jgi:hypothetical protein
VLTISSEATWPLALVGEVDGRKVDRYSYRPQSDYMFTLNSYPLIIIEICSREDEADHFRMLLQGVTRLRRCSGLPLRVWFLCGTPYFNKTLVLPARKYIINQSTLMEYTVV